ncbi:hypothetical protein GJ699_07595 [Duganella sp. FT80W]|uniref:Twin-arginine translocation signal domain-containing protein n=2 Tax=Duganella guangzhouensis TaxID=2666084 RepID=A0A6I2KVL0_9BURK|nr:hypothetical protein [Duganella guangzhouensis]
MNMTTPTISRRSALKALGVATLASVAGQLLLATRAKAALEPAGQGLKDFLAVSTTLTGKNDLNPTLALALYKAMQQTQPELDGALLKLKTALAQDTVLAGGDKTAFADEQKAEHALSQAILQGWYLGTVGKGKKAVCVTYVDALSNRAVADTLVPPSYSYGPCGAWQVKP